jgi:hypothetical protein
MCLILFKWEPNNLIVAANREESRTKPLAEPASLRKEGITVAISGPDYGRLENSQARIGTWLGINSFGLLVAVTNRDDGHEHNTLRSRGWLVMEMLCYPSATSAVEVAKIRLDEGGYGGGNYIILDKKEAWWVRAPGQKDVTLQQIDPGIHCITNLDLDDPNDDRINFCKQQASSGLDMSACMYMLAHPNIVVKDANWGTLSSTVVIQDKSGLTFSQKASLGHTFRRYDKLFPCPECGGSGYGIYGEPGSTPCPVCNP